MSEIDYEKLAKNLEKLYAEKPELLFKLYNQLRKYFVTNEDFKQLIEQMNIQFQDLIKQIDKRFEENRIETNRRFEEINKRFEENRIETNRRFEENRIETNRRFEEINKRFEAIDRRFEEINKRFEDNRIYLDRRFKELSLGYGGTFEGFNKTILKKILEEREIPVRAFNATPLHFKDPDRIVHKKTTDVEINIFSEAPPIIGEVTSSLIEIQDLNTFIRKIKFIEKKFQKTFKRFFITLYVDDFIKKEAKRLFDQNDIEVITME